MIRNLPILILGALIGLLQGALVYYQSDAVSLYLFIVTVDLHFKLQSEALASTSHYFFFSGRFSPYYYLLALYRLQRQVFKSY